MTQARRNFLRSVMQVAWGLYRDGDRTFANALAGAWVFMKRLKAAKPVFRSRRGDRSAVVETMRGQAFVGGRRSAAYLTAVCGR